MRKQVHELPTVLTSFGYRPEYKKEVEGMVASVKEHHPDWPLIVGRGPVDGQPPEVMEVETPQGKLHWRVPVPLSLDRGKTDWLKITYVKGWWIAKVWHEFGRLSGQRVQRIVWADADARFNGPLDIEVEPSSEVVAGPWWYDREKRGYDVICSGLLLFQGEQHGIVGKMLDQWESRCVWNIEHVPPQTRPWEDSDQEILTVVLDENPEASAGYELQKLDMRKYVACPVKDGKLVGRGLVDSWYMIEKMRLPETRGVDWPPSEEYRRHAPIGTPLPGWDPEAAEPVVE